MVTDMIDYFRDVGNFNANLYVMNKQTKQANTDLGIDAGGSLAGAGAGLLFAGPVGAIVGAIIAPVVTDIAKRLLSPREVDRIDRAKQLARQQIQRQLDSGARLREDLGDYAQKAQVEELIEGTLLAARDAYEEKKIPLIANLCSRALFTSTPIENLNQTLITGQQLSYRQLCLLSLLRGTWVGGHEPGLSSKMAHENHRNDEHYLGVLYDIMSMASQRIILQRSREGSVETDLTPGTICPNRLRLMYPGELLVNTMSLGALPDEDLSPIKQLLS